LPGIGAVSLGGGRGGLAPWGRPPLAPELVSLIEQMSRENSHWSRRRIASELAKLGHAVDKDTVAKYMPRPTRRPRRPPSQTWKTFLRNHLEGTIAIDFLTVPTVTFNVLYVFFVLSLERRRVLHVNVTAHPYGAWAAQQIVEAIGAETVPARLIRDRDAIFDAAFDARVDNLGVQQSPHLAAFSVAKRIRGKMGRHIASRATRSPHRAWGPASAAPAPPVCRLLQ
jgi:hypothetical protein